jgi:hypothetical protein
LKRINIDAKIELEHFRFVLEPFLNHGLDVFSVRRRQGLLVEGALTKEDGRLGLGDQVFEDVRVSVQVVVQVTDSFCDAVDVEQRITEKERWRKVYDSGEDDTTRKNTPYWLFENFWNSLSFGVKDVQLLQLVRQCSLPKTLDLLDVEAVVYCSNAGAFQNVDETRLK